MGRGLTRLIPGMRFSSVAEAEGDAGLRAADLRSQNPLSMDTRRTLLARRRIVLPRSGGGSHVTQVVLYLRKRDVLAVLTLVGMLCGIGPFCQGRSKRRPLGRSKREPVRWTVRRGFSGEKGLGSVAEEALLPRSACGGAGFVVLGWGFVFGG